MIVNHFLNFHVCFYLFIKLILNNIEPLLILTLKFIFNISSSIINHCFNFSSKFVYVVGCDDGMGGLLLLLNEFVVHFFLQVKHQFQHFFVLAAAHGDFGSQAGGGATWAARKLEVDVGGEDVLQRLHLVFELLKGNEVASLLGLNYVMLDGWLSVSNRFNLSSELL